MRIPRGKWVAKHRARELFDLGAGALRSVLVLKIGDRDVGALARRGDRRRLPDARILSLSHVLPQGRQVTASQGLHIGVPQRQRDSGGDRLQGLHATSVARRRRPWIGRKRRTGSAPADVRLKGPIDAPHAVACRLAPPASALFHPTAGLPSAGRVARIAARWELARLRLCAGYHHAGTGATKWSCWNSRCRRPGRGRA